MNNKRAIDIQSLFFYVFFSLPLIYIFDHPAVSRTIRFSVLLGILLLVFCFDSTRRIFYKNLIGLGAPLKWALGVLLVLFGVSAAFSQPSATTILFGISPEYMGLVSWVAFIVLGVFFSDKLGDYMRSKATMMLSLTLSVLSLMTSLYEIFHGLRIPGLMLQATTMGMYGVFLGVIGFSQLRLAATRRRQAAAGALVIVSTLIVMLTQSRIALMAYILSFGALALWTLRSSNKRYILAFLAISLVIVVSLLPHLFSGYFARFQADSVGNGTQYRLELYELTAKDILSENKLLGNGPGTMPDTINDESRVPDDIQLSLAVGDVFLSSHNMYLDIGYSFGLVAAIIILAITGFALSRPFLLSTPLAMELWLLFVVGVINTLFNVTSLELTSWYFLLLVSLISLSKTRRHA